jgi:NADH/NAD ratio-sensing transcriptional regulator Rex
MAKSAKKVIVKTAVKKKPLKKASKKLAKKAVKKAVKKSTSKKISPKKKKEDLNCFLTSACVDFYGLKDTGYELNTLRNFRDSYLAHNKEGRELIQNYYQVSPALVDLINKDKARLERYAYIYSNVKEACVAIEKRHFLKAKTIYTNMVNTLIKNYSNG